MKTFSEYCGEAFEPKRIVEREQELFRSVKGKVEEAGLKLETWLKDEEEKKELKYLLTNYLDKARLLSEKSIVEHIPLFKKIADLTNVKEFKDLGEVHELLRKAKKLRDEKAYTLTLNKKYYDKKDDKIVFFTGLSDDKNVTFYFKTGGEVYIFYPHKSQFSRTNSKIEGRFDKSENEIIVTFKALESDFERMLLNIKKDNRVYIKKQADFSYVIN